MATVTAKATAAAKAISDGSGHQHRQSQKAKNAKVKSKRLIKFGLQDPDTSKAHILTAKAKPSLLLDGETPRLLDEWQVAPELWNAVRFAVDRRRANGQFILNGSVIPTRTDDMHTGTGRIARMGMRTMSL